MACLHHRLCRCGCGPHTSIAPEPLSNERRLLEGSVRRVAFSCKRNSKQGPCACLQCSVDTYLRLASSKSPSIAVRAGHRRLEKGSDAPG